METQDTSLGIAQKPVAPPVAALVHGAGILGVVASAVATAAALIASAIVVEDVATSQGKQKLTCLQLMKTDFNTGTVPLVGVGVALAADSAVDTVAAAVAAAGRPAT